MARKKDELKELKEKLALKRKPVWDQLSQKEKKEAETLARDYLKFLSQAKTERECVEVMVELLKKRGFTEDPSPYCFTVFRDKMLAVMVAGKKPPYYGLRIIATHIDSPRLDLKLHPLYEDLDMAFLKTHYYGGIKKYHWVARPLALHGVVVKPDGTKVKIAIGEDPKDPVFTICDLLPHLARKTQGDKKLSEAIPGEKLNLLVGGLPLVGQEEDKDRIKLSILKLLNEKYGLTEEDFVSAELEVVPAGPAVEVGLDRAFIGSYGQDDRICAFSALTAALALKEPLYSTLLVFMDKEEIGSDGNTGAKSRFLEKLVYDYLKMYGITPGGDTVLETFLRSKAVSGDVTAGMDPHYMEVHEKLNDARVGYGVVLTKYTGHGGKYMANDAHAEYMAWLRRIFSEAGVVYQAASMGKVDEGGGGTVAKYLASYGLDIVDLGPPILSMHSPFEVAHKADLYMTYRAYLAFLSAGD